MKPGISGVVHSWQCAWNYFGLQLHESMCELLSSWSCLARLISASSTGWRPALTLITAPPTGFMLGKFGKTNFASGTCWNPLKYVSWGKQKAGLQSFLLCGTTAMDFIQLTGLYIVPWGQAQATHVILWWQPAQPVTETRPLMALET